MSKIDFKGKKYPKSKNRYSQFQGNHGIAFFCLLNSLLHFKKKFRLSLNRNSLASKANAAIFGLNKMSAQTASQKFHIFERESKN